MKIHSVPTVQTTNNEPITKYSDTEPMETMDVIYMYKITYAPQEATDHIVLIWPQSL